ncbi:TATA box-binding protein-associated factor RNA polymerase I subunit C [Labrus mixtus]|uniref:TATA box-binding protein-associated factor RNA polymerase I subunit C n=1 Tax=Labrus mixtus TaxID=508554 RepID=UPI0029C03B6C|nr:TATA box-binding protein-associated factor RNA polymerase I subunit C [Labrus mixtus]
MDYQFPQQLFPSFYNCGPPDSALKHRAGSWGCYDRVRAQSHAGPLSSWTFTSRHQVKGETWRHTEPVTIPLLSPKKSVLWPSTPPNPLDFREHMQNFFMDHCQDAFGCTSELLGENFYFKHGRKAQYRKDSVHMWKVKKFLDIMNLKICQRTYSSETLDRYSALLSDAVHSVPPDLLGDLLHEELTEQRDRLLFSEGATGGALAFVPFSQSCSDSQHGCLIYPRNQGLDCLNFHRVELQNHRGGSSCVDTSSSSPFSFQLKGPVRQISSVSLLNQSCVAVRSDYLCGVWRLSETNEPCLLQAVNTKEVATCISVSPHVLGEVLVASESGAVNLWTVGRGMQKVREEDSNLYFNAKSAWRWCEFSAHPRVMLYADRTGVELTDIRGSPFVGHTLFRISNTSECRSGERLILSKYLGDAHCFHHLVTTQYSAYIMDERFPGVPMLKWDHYMQSPPMFCHLIPGSASSESAVGGAVTTKVLLGSHSSQEITLLQYSGGRVEASSSHGPPQSLLRPRDSLKHLPVQIPHRCEFATNRLSSPAAGLTCIQMKGGKEAGAEERLCIIQLTEAGDIFYQILEPEQPDMSSPPAAEDKPLSNKLPQQPLKEAATPGRKTAAGSKLVVSETSSDEDVIEPTQAAIVNMFVNETPERKQQESSDSSSEDSVSGGRRNRKLMRLKLQGVVNDEPEPDQRNGFDKEAEEGNIGENNLEKPESITETVSSSSLSGDGQTRVKLSDNALAKWKHWLMKLVQKNREKKPRSHCRQHLTVPVEGLLQPPDNRERDSAEEERIQSLRRDLRACMSRRSLLVHSAVSDSITAPDIKPVPDPVDTDTYMDQLSQRLTLSWQGEEAWRAWWEDNLGLNREKKVADLRRKRRTEKAARRASGQRMDLSGSFASSMSYQAELSDFSDSQGWAYATSQEALSEPESIYAQSEGIEESGTPKATTPSIMQNDGPDPGTPQSFRDKPDEQQTPRSSLTQPQTPRLNSTWQTDDPVPATPQSVREKPDEQQTPRSSLALTQPQTPRLNSISQTDGPVPATPQSVREKPDEQRTPRSSRILTVNQPQKSRLNSTPTSQRKNKRPAEDVLKSLFAPQIEPSQHDSFYLDEGSSLHPAPPPVASSSFQLHGSQFLSQQSFRANLSQDSSAWSQSRTFSQSSQGRLGPSQASQPKKKKSRMGF